MLSGRLERQNLRLSSQSPESESAFYQDPQSIQWNETLRSLPAVSLRTQAIANRLWHFSDHRRGLRNGYVFKEMLVKEVFTL